MKEKESVDLKEIILILAVYILSNTFLWAFSFLFLLFPPLFPVFISHEQDPLNLQQPFPHFFLPIWPFLTEMQSRGRHRASGESFPVAMLTCNLYRP